jgi:DNA adenine methylase
MKAMCLSKKAPPGALSIQAMQINPAVKRPLLSYFGGKWVLAPWIIGYMPEHRIYVEPFGGAASVLLRKPRSRVEVYNDLDEEIVGFFRVLQNSAQCRELFRLSKRTPYSRREYDQAFEATSDPVIRAQRLLVRSYMGHHSSCVFMRHGSFSSTGHRTSGPYKAKTWSGYPRHLVSFLRRLSGVMLECCDALTVIKNQDAHDTLFFIDPPYVHGARSYSRSAYYRHELTDDQHVDLLNRLKAVKGSVMISGYPNQLYDDLLIGWRRITRKSYAATSSGLQPRTEVLWISPNVHKGAIK